MKKTAGQQVYEYCHPSRIRVVRASALPFATSDDVLTLPNPVHQAPWHLLTQDCRDYWERYAWGHHAVKKEIA